MLGPGSGGSSPAAFSLMTYKLMKSATAAWSPQKHSARENLSLLPRQEKELSPGEGSGTQREAHPHCTQWRLSASSDMIEKEEASGWVTGFLLGCLQSIRAQCLTHPLYLTIFAERVNK